MQTIITQQKSHPIYRAADIQAWEKRWFALGNSSYGLMQQAALLMANAIAELTAAMPSPSFLIWCGTGNNGGDGYVLARLFKEQGINVAIFAPKSPNSNDARLAKLYTQALDIPIYTDNPPTADVHIDALFGNGLNHALSIDYQAIIALFNRQKGLKIAVDLPSGLHPDTAQALPIATQVDYTLCLMGLKMGLLTADGRHYAGQIILLPLIPKDSFLTPIAHLNTKKPTLAPRATNSHKGDFGHVLIIGGHANMGGAVIMAGEAAMACGAGKVTVMCHQKHHTAILARSPHLMVKDISDGEHFGDFLQSIDSVAFGMGLGRDDWSWCIYQAILPQLIHARHLKSVVIDADALYFLAKSAKTLPHTWIGTPHTAEAARLLQSDCLDITQNRMTALDRLHAAYGGQWVLKGAGSLSLELDGDNATPKRYVCAFGNAGMATAGMGDVLSGMIAGLQGQAVSLADCVALHALAGDRLATQGQIGMRASDMVGAICWVVNGGVLPKCQFKLAKSN